jgi:hypothetical protein
VIADQHWKHLPKFLSFKSYCTLIPSVIYYGLQFFMAQNCDFKVRGVQLPAAGWMEAEA